MIRIPVFVFLFLLYIGTAHAQTPDAVLVRIPDGNGTLQSTDLSGILTSAVFSCTWSVTENSAVFDCDGPYSSTNFYYPEIRVSWAGVTEPLPLHLEVLSPGTGACSFAGDYLDPTLGWQNLSYEELRTGDWELGQQFPVCDAVQLEFALDSPNVVYDFRLALQWGPGVDSDPTSWDGIKMLYR